MNEPSSSSTYLGFGFAGLSSLHEEICRPFTEMTVTLDRVRTPTELVLWRKDDTGLKIRSKMHDLAEKVEVGILQFATTTRTNEIEPDGYWETAERFSAKVFDGPNSISKLVVDESGYSCESGILVTSISGKELVVVADVFPCHIAVLGIEGLSSASKPEYGMARYRRIDW